MGTRIGRGGSRMRWPVRMVVLAVLAPILAVTPPIQQAQPAGARQAPVTSTDACTARWAPNTVLPECGDDEASLSGAFDGPGSTVTVTLDPSGPPCQTGTSDETSFTPEGCYPGVTFGQSDEDIYGLQCFTLDHDDGVAVELQSCDFLYDDVEPNQFSTIVSSQAPGGGNCGGRGDWSVYAQGGPASEPDGPWAARAEQYLACEFTWHWPRPDGLRGPAWVLITAGATGWAPVLIPIAGDLANDGVVADFEIVETGTVGTYDFNNLSTHRNPRYFEITDHQWSIEDEPVANSLHLRSTFDIPGWYDIGLLVGDDEGNEDAWTEELQVPQSLLLRSLIVDTEIGDNIATEGEEFDVILVLRVSDDGVGQKRNVTMTEDPFTWDRNLSQAFGFDENLFEIIAQPSDTGPWTMSPGETKELRWSVRTTRTQDPYQLRARFSYDHSFKLRYGGVSESSGSVTTPTVIGEVVEGDGTTTTTTTTTLPPPTTTTTTLPPPTTTTTTTTQPTTTTLPPTTTTTTTQPTTTTTTPPFVDPIVPPDDPDDAVGELVDLEDCAAGDDENGGAGGAATGSVHASAVDCLALWGVTADAPEAYIPADPVTRGQLATFLARLAVALGVELPAGEDAFGDDDGSVHEAAINQLAALGILRGDDDGLVSPADQVTRGQMATILVRLWAVLTGETLPVGDDAFGDDDGHTHEGAINALAAAGITHGTDDGYDPDAPVRGDQMATFLTRLVERLSEPDADPEP